jgi:tRNA(adenine34) deaminase
LLTTFEIQVARQIERMQRLPWDEIERQTAQKRVAWLRESPQAARFRAEIGAHPSPRQAFELLFFEYMGLSPADLPIVSESPESIVWRSQNRCPTLEAARRLGLDTRLVCRQIYERSTQAFLTELYPRLSFSRSYAEIRPYSAYCLERIDRVESGEMERL